VSGGSGNSAVGCSRVVVADGSWCADDGGALLPSLPLFPATDSSIFVVDGDCSWSEWSVTLTGISDYHVTREPSGKHVAGVVWPGWS